MKLLKKRFVTLVEVLIAIGLLSVILTFLFGFYLEINNMQLDLEKTRRKNFHLLYVQKRLSDVLQQISNEKDLISSRTSLLYTTHDEHALSDEMSLVMMFDNGVNIPSIFSYHVLGKLYLDKDGHLCLAIWPSPNLWINEGNILEKSPLKKEVLLEKVSDLKFEFFVPPSLEKKKVEPSQVQTGREKKDPELGKWHKEWLIEYQEIPAMVKVILTQDQKQTSFVFPLIHYGKAINYTK